jgi:hypothetical protein
MNLTRALPLAFLIGSMAFSQAPSKQFSSDNFRANCPIELKASLKSTGKIVRIVPVQNGRSAGNEKGLRITLSNPRSAVVAAHITVHGFPVGGRVAPAVLYFPDPAEITKTVVLDQAVAAGQNASIDVEVPNFSAVTSISLDTVTFSDGSGWHPEDGKYCRAVGLPIDATGDALTR